MRPPSFASLSASAGREVSLSSRTTASLISTAGGAAGIAGNLEVEHGWAYGRHTRRLVTFSLEGETVLPPQSPPEAVRPIVIEHFDVDADLAVQGADEYGRCGSCHGPGAKSGGMAPDLRASAVVGSAEAFAAVVRDGAKMANGMPRYAHLTNNQLTALPESFGQLTALQMLVLSRASAFAW